MAEEKKTGTKKWKLQKLIVNLLPFAALIVLLAVFVGIVTSRGYKLSMYLEIVFNEGIVLSVVATGAIFIYTLGSFDISLGAATLFAAVMGVMSYNATQSLGVMIMVILAAGVGCSLVNSVLASVFHIPVFVTTVAMMSVLTAFASQIITTNGGSLGGISIPGEVVESMDHSGFKIAVLAVWFLVCVFIFDFTKFGRREKFIGGNPVCAELTGIPYNRYAVLGFLLAGVGVGVGAFLTLVYTPSVTTSTAGDIGMNIMVAIVFGGMPIAGGAKSRIYAAVAGGFSYIILNNILDLLIESSTGYGITQIISAVFFMAVVYVASANYRTQMLPR